MSELLLLLSCVPFFLHFCSRLFRTRTKSVSELLKMIKFCQVTMRSQQSTCLGGETARRVHSCSYCFGVPEAVCNEFSETSLSSLLVPSPIPPGLFNYPSDSVFPRWRVTSSSPLETAHGRQFTKGKNGNHPVCLPSIPRVAAGERKALSCTLVLESL